MEHDCTQETLKLSMQGSSGSWDLQCMAAFRSCQHSKEEMKLVSPGASARPPCPVCPCSRRYLGA